MKKFSIIVPIVIVFLFTFSVKASKENREFDNLTTINLKSKLNIDIKSISELCSYERCIYVDNDTEESMIESFVDEYTKDLDEELKATLKIKGIKITNIIYKK